jgi:predicted dehydrogenase
VGFVGAGPAAQAIHLPTLARLEDLYRVAHVMDVDADAAVRVAARYGAASSTSMDEMLADENVDVVVLCSPPAFHAGQVQAACRAGVRAVLCEKPLAMDLDEARQVAEVISQTGVPVIVGAMHLFDPAWSWVRGELDGPVTAVSSHISLPPNAWFEDFATELLGRPEFPAPPLDTPDARGAFLRRVFLNLVIHDLPLVRRLAPVIDEVLFAHVVEPFGYAARYRSGDTVVDLTGGFARTWSPDWSLAIETEASSAHVDFPPSYVHSGSARACVSTAHGTRTLSPRGANGYEGEWRALAAVARGAETPDTGVDDAVADLEFAVRLADAFAEEVRSTR